MEGEGAGDGAVTYTGWLDGSGAKVVDREIADRREVEYKVEECERKKVALHIQVEVSDYGLGGRVEQK